MHLNMTFLYYSEFHLGLQKHYENQHGNSKASLHHSCIQLTTELRHIPFTISADGKITKSMSLQECVDT